MNYTNARKLFLKGFLGFSDPYSRNGHYFYSDEYVWRVAGEDISNEFHYFGREYSFHGLRRFFGAKEVALVGFCRYRHGQ